MKWARGDAIKLIQFVTGVLIDVSVLNKKKLISLLPLNRLKETKKEQRL